MKTSPSIARHAARYAPLAGAAWLLLCGPARAQAQTLPEPPPRQGGDVIAGLLVNQTVSSLGLIFFRDFAEAWRDKPDADSYTLTIVEKPSRRFGNQIWIVNGQQRVLTMTLPYRYDRIHPIAEQAADASFTNLVSLAIPSGAGADPDMGTDEL